MLNFIVCDDNSHMLDRLCMLFEKAFLKNDFDAKIILKTTHCEDVISYISAKNKVNVVVLDIDFNNSKMNGLEVANEIRKVNKDCYIIFTTSHFEYVMEAYKFKTFDYLIKTAINVDLLSKTLTRLFDDVYNTSNKFFKIDNKGTFIDLNDVQFIEKRGVKLIYHTFYDIYETYNSFTKIQDRLPNNFVRCHKSFIANVNNITKVSLLDNTITFKNSSVCYIGPKYKNYFVEVIDYDSVSK